MGEITPVTALKPHLQPPGIARSAQQSLSYKLQPMRNQHKQTPPYQQTLNGTAATRPDARYGPPSTGPGPFAMPLVTNALPYGGFQHPPMASGHRPNYQQSQPYPGMLPMKPSQFYPPHPGSVMVPVYYMQNPHVPHYYAQNTMPSNYGQHSTQDRGNFNYHYQMPLFTDHLKSPGYYQQAPRFHDTEFQMADYMNRRYSQDNFQHEAMHQARRPSYRRVSSSRDQSFSSVDTARQSNVRGPPRKTHQSGHAIWIGNLPPNTDLMALVGHICLQAPGLRSVFLISKSNCAFANFKEEHISVQAQKAIHESTFRSARLVCRLRKNSAESIESPVVIAAGTSNPAASTVRGGQPEEILSAVVLPAPNKQDTINSEPYHANASSISNTRRDRYFVLKSLTLQDLEESVKTGIWATQSHNEELLDNAFKTAGNVYLVFSANKSGEYFGFARMTSGINRDPEAAIRFAPQTQDVDENDLPKAVTVEAKDNVPNGRILDDSARGTIFWEADDVDDELDAESEAAKVKESDEEEEMQTLGKPFHLQWLSTARLPFYRSRGLRNPWNSNREVKIARDGTEIEPSVGQQLIGLMNHNASGFTWHN